MSTQWETIASKRNEPNFLNHWCESDWTWMKHKGSHLRIRHARGKGHFDNSAFLRSTSTLIRDPLSEEDRAKLETDLLSYQFPLTPFKAPAAMSCGLEWRLNQYLPDSQDQENWSHRL